jgi:cell division protein FtsQ
MTQKKYRNKNSKPLIFRLAVFMTLSALFCGFIYYLFLGSSVFTIRQLHVQGNDFVSKEEVINLSRLHYGDRFFRVNLSKTKETIEKHPYIKNAELNRKGLSTINIVVREREEYAIIPYMGSYVYLDNEMVVLDVSDGTLGSNLCLVTGIEFNHFEIGKVIQVLNKASLETAYEILEAAKEADILEMISEINIDESGQIKVVTFNGIEALFGQMGNPAYSVLALKEALITLHTRNINNVIIDMRYDGHITVQDRARQEEDL